MNLAAGETRGVMVGRADRSRNTDGQAPSGGQPGRHGTAPQISRSDSLHQLSRDLRRRHGAKLPSPVFDSPDLQVNAMIFETVARLPGPIRDLAREIPGEHGSGPRAMTFDLPPVRLVADFRASAMPPAFHSPRASATRPDLWACVIQFAVASDCQAQPGTQRNSPRRSTNRPGTSTLPTTSLHSVSAGRPASSSAAIQETG